MMVMVQVAWSAPTGLVCVGAHFAVGMVREGRGEIAVEGAGWCSVHPHIQDCRSVARSQGLADLVPLPLPNELNQLSQWNVPQGLPSHVAHAAHDTGSCQAPSVAIRPGQHSSSLSLFQLPLPLPLSPTCLRHHPCQPARTTQLSRPKILKISRWRRCRPRDATLSSFSINYPNTPPLFPCVFEEIPPRRAK